MGCQVVQRDGDTGVVLAEILLAYGERPPQEGFSLAGSLKMVECIGQVVEAKGDVRMVGAKGLLLDRQCATKQTFGILDASLSNQQRSEVAEAGGEFGMVRAQRLLGDGELAAVEGLCFSISPFDPAQLAKIVEHGRNRVTFWTKLLFENLQGAEEVGLHITQSALHLVNLREIVERHGHIHVIGTQRLLEQAKRFSIQRFCFVEAALLLAQSGERNGSHPCIRVVAPKCTNSDVKDTA